MDHWSYMFGFLRCQRAAPTQEARHLSPLTFQSTGGATPVLGQFISVICYQLVNQNHTVTVEMLVFLVGNETSEDKVICYPFKSYKEPGKW